MDPQRWERVKDLFEIGEPMTPAEREAMLAQETDSIVRNEVEYSITCDKVVQL